MSARLPKFVTFTGADARTDINRMEILARQYPVEWGILFSPGRQGHDNRYPSPSTIRAFVNSDLTLAAHLCGEHADAVMAGRQPDLAAPLSRFKRLQINHSYPDPYRIAKFGSAIGAETIIQWRKATGFPNPPLPTSCLYDLSGGRGTPATHYPVWPGYCVGYAGGLGPENAQAAIQSIGADGDYWLDMETNVRTDNWMDLDMVEAVCRRVFG